MVKAAAVFILFVAVGVIGHRAYQVLSAPAPLTVQESAYGYSERWVPYGDGTMVKVATRFNIETGRWDIMQYYTHPIPIDEELIHSNW